MPFISFNTNNQFIEGIRYEHARTKQHYSAKTG